MMRAFVIGAALLASAINAQASDLEKAARRGYAVIAETNVSDSFEGCEHGRIVPLDNGLLFECRTYRYHYAYRPEVLILQSIRTGDILVIIGDDEYDGQVMKRPGSQ